MPHGGGRSLVAAWRNGQRSGPAAGLLVVLLAVPAGAMVPLGRAVLSSLDNVPNNDAVRVAAFPLDDGTVVALELEPFEVWAPGAVVVERGADGERLLAPPTTRYFRGRVVGEPKSWAFLAKDETLRGFVATGGRLFAVAPAGDAYRDPRAGSESLVRQIDSELDSPLDRPLFRCDNEILERSGLAVPVVAHVRSQLVARAAATSVPYVATLGVETDWELYQILGSTPAVTTFVADLVAAASSIYYRDVRTSLLLNRLDVYSSASDPWSATDTLAALSEVGAHWYPAHNDVARSSVVFLSGKTSAGMQGGIAWRPGLCELQYGYAVCGAIDGEFSTTNPSLYWDLLCFTHELGHNFNTPHTHCYSPQIDQCCTCGAEQCPGPGCPGPVPSGGGTIMSYCHCVSPGLSNIVLYLGIPGQSSERVTDVMRTHVESLAASNPSCIPEILLLNVVKDGTGSGTVTSSPSGINCGSDCSESYTSGTVVTLTATAAGGSTFAGWSGSGCSGTGTCQVTMSAAKSVTATFNALAQYTLTVSKDGTGTGTVSSSPAGIACGGDCSETYYEGTVVRLTAVADVASAFTGWSGAGCSGTGTCQVTMDAAKSVTATFTDVSACTMTVTDQAFTGSQLYESCHGIYAGPNVSVTTSSGHLTLRAAAIVVLRNGVSVGTGAKLTIAIDPALAGT